MCVLVRVCVSMCPSVRVLSHTPSYLLTLCLSLYVSVYCTSLNKSHSICLPIALSCTFPPLFMSACLLAACLPACLPPCLPACCPRMLVALSFTLYCAGRSSSEGQESSAKEHCCPSRAPFFLFRVHVSSMSSPLSALCLHFPSCGLCRCLLSVKVVHASLPAL